MRGDALRKLLAGGALNAGGQVRLHQAGGAFGKQRRQIDAIDDVERVDDIALRFGHLLAFAIANQAVYVDVAKRHIAVELQAEHDHARDPEKYDVETGDQCAGRIKARELRCLLGPAQGREWPERGRKPGVEHVLVLAQRDLAAQLRACLSGCGRGVARHVDVAGLVIPGRDAMAPPQLAADAPVLNIAHPLVIGLVPVLRYEADAASLDCSDRRPGQWLDAHVPLIGEVRFDHCAAAIAARHHQLVRFYPVHKSRCLQIGHHALTRFEAIEAAVGRWHAGVELRIGRKDIDQWQRVSLADRVIIEIMRWCDLYAAGAEGGVDKVIGNDG